eukprot:3654510-Pyramimonas_sp.AAC.1
MARRERVYTCDPAATTDRPARGLAARPRPVTFRWSGPPAPPKGASPMVADCAWYEVACGPPDGYLAVPHQHRPIAVSRLTSGCSDVA